MRKFYILTVIFALSGISQVWANNAKIEQEEFKGNRAWSGPHADFIISGDGQSTTTFGGDGRKLAIEKNKEQTISWTVEEGFDIHVTGLKLKVGSSTPGDGNFYLYGERIDKIAGWNTNVIDITDLSQGNDGNIKLSGSKDFNIYYLDVTYTVTPTSQPAVVTAETSVIVTIDVADKQTVDIKNLFALPANAHSEFTLGYKAGKGVLEGTNFYATSAGAYTVQAQIAPKENCHEGSAWSSAIINVMRRDPVLKLTSNAAAVQVLKAIDLSELIAEHVGDAIEYSVTSENMSKATLNGAVFSATEVGEYTVQIKSKEGDQYNETSQDVTVTVNAKPTPKFVRNLTQEEADALLVEGIIENAFTLTNVSGDENLEITVATLTISDVKKGDEVLAYDVESNTITPLNAGTATIQFVQKETDEIGPASSEVFTFTVSKHENMLYVKGVADFVATIQPDAVLENVVFSANNNDYVNNPIEWAVKDGAEIAVFDPEAKTITANHNLGTASWTLAQAESYKFKAGEATFSVKVALAEEGVCYVLEDDELVEWSTVGRTQEYEVNGPAAQLKFQARRVALLGFSTNGDFFAEYSTTTDDDEWNRLEPYMDLPETDKWYEFTYDIPENTKRVRMRSQTGAQGYRCIQNVKVTRKGYVRAENVAIAVPVKEEANTALKIDYSVVNGGDLKIICDNDKFTLDSYAIAGVECIDGTANIPVAFAAQDEGGTYVANIVVYNSVYHKELTLTASVSKTTPVISWENIEMVYGEEAALNATVDADEIEIKYAVVDESDVIHIANGQVFADKTGNAQIRAYVEESDKYNAAEKIIDVTVNKAQQTINWEQELEGLEVNDEIQLEAIASSGLEVTFVSLDESIARIDENNVLYAYQEGEVTIKAVQAGNDNYESAEMERKVTISQATDTRKSQVIIWNNQTLEVDMAEGAEIVVLTAVAEPSGYDVTYTSSDITIAKIGVMDDGEMIYYYVEPVRVGKVQITASQEGDDTWKAAIDVTKEFEIINSEDPQTGIDNVENAKHATKILLNGQILILRDGKIYDLRGMKVR